MGRIKWGFVVVVLAVAAMTFFHFSDNSSEEFSDKKFMFDTYCTITAYGENAEEAVEKAFAKAQEIHDITDAFSEHSEVYKINSAKSDETVVLSNHMVTILETVTQIERESGRAFESCIAPVVLLWEFSAEGRVPTEEEVAEALNFTGEGKVFFDSKNKVIVKSDENVKLDLGGAAKGYAADMAAMEIMETEGVTGVIIDFGGNIVCSGKNPNSDDGKWRIGVQKPFAPTGEYDEQNIIELEYGAVVTSGTYQRYFEKDGKMYHHIIDPKTGYPAERDYSSVTVIAENSLLGDCLSTACFVLGRDEGVTLAEQFDAKIYFE